MRIGVIGAGKIVPTFLAAAELVPGMEVHAIYARNAAVRNELGRQYHIPAAYDTYEKLLADPDIETVYIALPNQLHFEFADSALAAGKHVILEKPITVTLAEAGMLAALAKEKQLFLFEAITNQYNSNFYQIRDLLPQLGDIKIVQLNFSQYSSRYDDFKSGVIAPVFDPRQGGGALMDLNIYNIHLAVGWFGRPKAAHYYPNLEQGVDTSGILVLQYPDFQCVCIGAKDCTGSCSIRIQGEQGWISSDSAPNELQDFSYRNSKGEIQYYDTKPHKERLYDELEMYMQYYEHKDYRAVEERMQHSLKVMEVIEAVKRTDKTEY